MQVIPWMPLPKWMQKLAKLKVWEHNVFSSGNRIVYLNGIGLAPDLPGSRVVDNHCTIIAARAIVIHGEKKNMNDEFFGLLEELEIKPIILMGYG